MPLSPLKSCLTLFKEVWVFKEGTVPVPVSVREEHGSDSSGSC